MPFGVPSLLDLHSCADHHDNHPPPPPLQDTCEELMRYVKDLRRANTALVDAFEKSKKRQQAEKRKMKQELVAYMNRIQGNAIPNAIEVSQPLESASL